MNDNQLVEKIISGVKEVFSMMIMVEVNEATKPSPDTKDLSPELTSIIGFGGDVTGMLAIH